MVVWDRCSVGVRLGGGGAGGSGRGSGGNGRCRLREGQARSRQIIKCRRGTRICTVLPNSHSKLNIQPLVGDTNRPPNHEKDYMRGQAKHQDGFAKYTSMKI